MSHDAILIHGVDQVIVVVIELFEMQSFRGGPKFVDLWKMKFVKYNVQSFLE
jgi:hypothetical protein